MESKQRVKNKALRGFLDKLKLIIVIWNFLIKVRNRKMFYNFKIIGWFRIVKLLVVISRLFKIQVVKIKHHFELQMLLHDFTIQSY